MCLQRADGLTSVRAEDIANGDCAATLSLLWQLALHLEARRPSETTEHPHAVTLAAHAVWLPLRYRNALTALHSI